MSLSAAWQGDQPIQCSRSENTTHGTWRSAKFVNLQFSTAKADAVRRGETAQIGIIEWNETNKAAKHTAAAGFNLTHSSFGMLPRHRQMMGVTCRFPFSRQSRLTEGSESYAFGGEHEQNERLTTVCITILGESPGKTLEAVDMGGRSFRRRLRQPPIRSTNGACREHALWLFSFLFFFF